MLKASFVLSWACRACVFSCIGPDFVAHQISMLAPSCSGTSLAPCWHPACSLLVPCWQSSGALLSRFELRLSQGHFRPSWDDPGSFFGGPTGVIWGVFSTILDPLVAILGHFGASWVTVLGCLGSASGRRWGLSSALLYHPVVVWAVSGFLGLSLADFDSSWGGLRARILGPSCDFLGLSWGNFWPF